MYIFINFDTVLNGVGDKRRRLDSNPSLEALKTSGKSSRHAAKSTKNSKRQKPFRDASQNTSIDAHLVHSKTVSPRLACTDTIDNGLGCEVGELMSGSCYFDLQFHLLSGVR